MERSQIEELVYRTCLALDERDFKGFLANELPLLERIRLKLPG